MIEVRECSKAFGQTKAVNQATLDIGDREVFGLVGSNGAGKSTLLRMMAGIIRPDQGEILIDDLPVYENEEAKKLFFYISDDSYFPPNYTAVDMVRFYRNFYPEFRIKLFHELMDQFHLEKKQRISSFSKGMKKQLLVIIGVCAGTKYLLCDETFDGLDPVMRQAVKSLFASEIMNREFTPVIASHNLRELEDICDHVGLLHQGGVLLSKDLEEMKCNIQKIQCVFSSKEEEKRLLKQLDIVKCDRRGSLLTLTVRGSREEMIAMFAAADCLFHEVLPLSLEEIFISETEVQGYDIKKIVLG